MTDATPAPQTGAETLPASTTPAANEHGDWFNSLPKEAQDEILALRKEAKANRQKASAAELAAQQAEETRLADEKKWQQLAEKRAADLEALKPIKEQYEALQEAAKASNEKRIKQLPENVRSLVPTDYDPLKLRDWLDNAAPLLTQPRAPNLNPGTQGDGGTALPTLTAEQMEYAQLAGMKPEDYAKYLQLGQKARENPIQLGSK